jgi:hypothetical protein
MNDTEGTLLFVYNADSGLFNTVTDIAHKILSPQTYQCDLCALTHGYFTVRNEWTGFVKELGVPCEFVHRDQLPFDAGIDATQLPAIYRRVGNEWRLCLGPAEISTCLDIGVLKRKIVEGCVGRA